MSNQRDAGPGSRSALARQREVGAGREACGRGLLRVLASGIFLGLGDEGDSMNLPLIRLDLTVNPPSPKGEGVRAADG